MVTEVSLVTRLAAEVSAGAGLTDVGLSAHATLQPVAASLESAPGSVGPPITSEAPACEETDSIRSLPPGDYLRMVR